MRTPPGMAGRSQRLRVWLSFTLSAVVLALAAWIVVPAPTEPLLTLSVGAPEVSAWLLLAGLLAGVLALPDAPRRRAARFAAALATLAVLLACLPLARFPVTARRFDSAMRAALGDDYLRKVPRDARRAMRPRPLIVADLFRGFPTERARVTHGVPFATPDGIPLRLDVYQPPATTAPVAGAGFPAVVQIYGGAWQRGDPRANAGFARYLAAHGYVVFAIDYRHAPRWTWRFQLADVRSALAWIGAHAAEYDADAARLALLGRSAGAHLAMLAAYSPGALPVRAVVSFYGPVDLVESYRAPPRPDPLGVRQIETSFIGGTLDERPADFREASPISYATRPLPPTLLVYAGRDHIVEPRFGRLLYDRLRATGTTSVLLEIPWADHAFDAVPSGPSAQLALYHTERFLAWAVRPR